MRELDRHAAEHQHASRRYIGTRESDCEPRIGTTMGGRIINGTLRIGAKAGIEAVAAAHGIPSLECKTIEKTAEYLAGGEQGRGEALAGDGISIAMDDNTTDKLVDGVLAFPDYITKKKSQ